MVLLIILLFFFLLLRRHPTSTLFPYTTLFRSLPCCIAPTRSPASSSIRSSHRAFPIGSTAACEKSERSEEHTSELQSRFDLVCRLLLEKKKIRRTFSSPNLLDRQIDDDVVIID